MKKRTSRLGLLLLGIAAASYGVIRQRVKPVPDHPFLVKDGPLIMAHRGGEGLWPPNTLFAFQKAVDLGVDAIETDVHATADGVLVLRHDPTVDRTTDGAGAIRNYTWDELRKLDAGYRWTADNGQSFPFRSQGITIPTLEEALDAFPNIRFNMDIKPEDPPVVARLVSVLKAHRRPDSVLVGSFHDSQLARFRELWPEAATAAGVSETRLFYTLNRLYLGELYQAQAQAFQIPEYVEHRHLVTKRFIRAAHHHNVQVHVWTVNATIQMQRLLDWGVDGLMSDYPDRALALLGRSKSQ